MKNKFFTFIEPALRYIDNGHFFRDPFRWLYGIIAVLNLLLPVFMLIGAIDNNVFRGPGKFIVGFILIWLVVCVVAWFAFQLWWERKDKVSHTSGEHDDFVAIPVFSHFIQTSGECTGLWVGVVGASIALIGSIFGYGLGMPVQASEFGWLGIVIFPIIGYLIVVFARVVAEMYRALAAIANNTRKR